MKKEISLVNTVNQSNVLSQRLQYHDKFSCLTAQEKNIIFFLASCISSNDDVFEEISLSIKDFAKLLNISLRGGNQRTKLEESLYRLRTKGFWIISDDAKRKEVACWLDKAVIDYKKDIITLKLSDALKPYFLDLRDSARTIFQLGYTTLFRKKHSCDIYVLCKSVVGLKYWIMPYSAFLGLVGGSYVERYNNLWARVLKPSIDEINAKSDIVIDVKPIRKNNKVVAISFFARNKTAEEKKLYKIEQNKFKVKYVSSKYDLQKIAIESFPFLVENFDIDDDCRIKAQENKVINKIQKTKL